MRSIYERVRDASLALTFRAQLSGNYEEHIRFSKLYVFCKWKLGEE